MTGVHTRFGAWHGHRRCALAHLYYEVWGMPHSEKNRCSEIDSGAFLMYIHVLIASIMKILGGGNMTLWVDGVIPQAFPLYDSLLSLFPFFQIV